MQIHRFRKLPFPLNLNPDYRRLFPLVEPLLGNEPSVSSAKRAMEAFSESPDDSFNLLQRNSLVPLFFKTMKNLNHTDGIPETILLTMEQESRAWKANHVLKENALDIASKALNSASLPFAVIKGRHLCRVLYRQPYHRPHSDIDIVIEPERRFDAIRALHGAGFNPVIKKGSVFREFTMSGHRTDLDIHVDLLGPGRSRLPLAGRLLDSVDRIGNIPVSNSLWTLFILTVHPAFTEHVTARLIRSLDLARWISSHDCPWNEFVELMKLARLGIAAWTMLHWTNIWFGTSAPEEIEKALRPGRLRRSYIESWLAADPCLQYENHTALVRGCFSLALQNGPLDALHALKSKLKAGVGESKEIESISGIVSGRMTMVD